MKLKLIKLTLVLIGFSFGGLLITGCAPNHSGGSAPLVWDPAGGGTLPGAEIIFPVPDGTINPNNGSGTTIPGNGSDSGSVDSGTDTGGSGGENAGTGGSTTPNTGGLTPGAPEIPAVNVIGVIND